MMIIVVVVHSVADNFIKYIMNISRLLEHLKIWEFSYKWYKSEEVVVGENIPFINLVSVITAELNIHALRKKI